MQVGSLGGTCLWLTDPHSSWLRRTTCLAAVAHCPTPYRFLLQQSFDSVPCTQNLQQGEQMCPVLKDTTWSTHHAFHPRSGVVGQLLQGPHAAPLTLFLPSSSLSFSISLLVLLGCCAGSPTGMLWGNYGTRGPGGCSSWECRGMGAVDVSLSSTWADPPRAAFSGAATCCSAGTPEGWRDPPQQVSDTAVGVSLVTACTS